MLSDRRNYWALLLQGTFRNVGIELGSEKLVLPFLYTTLGGAVFFAGLLAPIVIIAKLGAQLLGARLIAVTRVGKWYLALGTTIAAIPLAVLSLMAGDIAVAWLPVAFILAALIIGFSIGFGTLTFQDMLGRVLSEGNRASLLFVTGAVVAVLTISAALFSQFATGFEPAAEAWRDHVHLVWTATAMMVLSSFAALAIREQPKIVAQPESRPGYLAALRKGMEVSYRLRWLRRFLVARVLLLSVEIVIPFFVVHAAEFYGDTPISLSFFVISSSIGMLIGGFVWPRISKISIQRVLTISAMIAFAAAMLALGRNLIPALQFPATHAVIFALLAFALQGVVSGNTVYVVNASDDEARPYCVALSNLVAGVAGVGLALVAGLISQQRGIIAALVIMGILNVIAALYVRTLSDPDDVREE